ncbi:SMI1 / KNR4 family protein [Planctomycetes bacterium MalM25]|nr:SMI1 / KNR4 family protein [Planctomycetes bacterium MalM25]
MPICTKREIAQLERQYSVQLPAIYKAFLLGSYPDVEARLVGSDIDMRYLPEIRRWAQELLVENDVGHQLPSDSFVFLMHQGYQFMYFPCDGTDNPPVFYYLEGDEKPRLIFERFSEWIASFSRGS